MTCTKGLHPDVKGHCKACKAAYDRAYYQSERGKESHRRAQSKYYDETLTEFQRNFNLLKNRRYKALKYREEKASGALQEQGRD